VIRMGIIYYDLRYDAREGGEAISRWHGISRDTIALCI
jgi:hypothetical protein